MGGSCPTHSSTSSASVYKVSYDENEWVAHYVNIGIRKTDVCNLLEYIYFIKTQVQIRFVWKYGYQFFLKSCLKT